MVTVAIGYIRKGRLSNLANLNINLVPLLILSFAVQVGIYCGYAFEVDAIKNYDILLHFISYIILLTALMGNFQNRWFIFITLGVILNFTAIFLNGGKMPVSYEAAETIGLNLDVFNSLLEAKGGTHQPLHSSALLWFLSDIIPIALPGFLSFLNNIYSIGDFIIFGGVAGLIQSTMVRDNLEEVSDDDPIQEDESIEFPDHPDDLEILNQMRESNSSEKVLDGNNTNHVDENMDSGETIVIKSVMRDDIDNTIDNEADTANSEKVELQEHDNELEYLLDKDSIGAADEGENNSGTTVGNVPLGTVEEGIEEESQFMTNVGIDDQGQDYEEVIDNTVDTEHHFIIEDGKIIKNPNYNNSIKEESIVDDTFDVENRMNDLEEQVEELEMTKTDLNHLIESNKAEEKEKNRLQAISDSERIELMKKMKERKEEGYSLVEVKVGGKKISLWKKEL